MFCSNDKLFQKKLSSCYGKNFTSNSTSLKICNFPSKIFDGGGGAEKSQKINCNKPKLGDHTGFKVKIETDGSNEVARRTP